MVSLYAFFVRLLSLLVLSFAVPHPTNAKKQQEM
jgi:hypothetical protein